MTSSGSSLLAGIYSGLTSTYSYLSSLNPDGVTVDGINKARTDSATSSTINQSFAAYLQTNFASIDKDNDGVISSAEMTNMTNLMTTQGLTKNELTQLYASGSSGLSAETMENILNHFDEMDTNHDGRITSEEIAAFNVNSSKQKAVDEYNNRRATDMSVFYGDDNSSSSSDSYSILSWKYGSSNNS